MPTGIDYLDEVWNTITGCQGIGCRVRDNCWARDMVRRFPQLHGYLTSDPDERVDFSKPHFHPNRLDKPLYWRKPRRIGVCFLGDWMDEQVLDEWIGRMLAVISDCPQHTFFTLTKQVDRLASIRPHLPNLWNGVSPTDQADANWMLPELLKVPGKRWISIEPMLGPTNIIWALRPQLHPSLFCLNWVVLGAESGPRRRPCPHEWMIDVVRQCRCAGTPVWVKQVDMGKRVSHDPAEWPAELKVREVQNEEKSI